ncbi:MAG: hypothetical protein R3C59_23285 [Planctomycetaceae bacterium]
MRVSTQNRLSRTHSPAFPVLAFGGCLLLCGCTSLPKFSATQDRLAVSGPIPVPVFDDLEESLPSSRIASARPATGLVSVPQPFAWKSLASSAGDRSIDGITIGHGGYRTVILGSLVGDDPLAIALTEALAKHVHENQMILGGIQAVVIRNPNPDGEARHKTENQNGVYLNRQFGSTSETTDTASEQEPEIRFLQGQLSEGQPQRVIHIRTLDGHQGIVAASSGAAAVARDVCGWLDFRFVELPGKSAAGTLERSLSQQNSCEVITFAFPKSSIQESLWENYGDSLLNLLLDEDFETRKLARTKRNSTAADRRGRKDADRLNRDD